MNKIKKLVEKLDAFYYAIGGQRMKNNSECKVIDDNIKHEAKCKADMMDAINCAEDENVRAQLTFRMQEGNYEYEDLISPDKVKKNISSEIPV